MVISSFSLLLNKLITWQGWNVFWVEWRIWLYCPSHKDSLSFLSDIWKTIEIYLNHSIKLFFLLLLFFSFFVFSFVFISFLFHSFHCWSFIEFSVFIEARQLKLYQLADFWFHFLNVLPIDIFHILLFLLFYDDAEFRTVYIIVTFLQKSWHCLYVLANRKDKLKLKPKLSGRPRFRSYEKDLSIAPSPYII